MAARVQCLPQAVFRAHNPPIRLTNRRAPTALTSPWRLLVSHAMDGRNGEATDIQEVLITEGQIAERVEQLGRFVGPNAEPRVFLVFAVL